MMLFGLILKFRKKVKIYFIKGDFFIFLNGQISKGIPDELNGKITNGTSSIKTNNFVVRVLSYEDFLRSRENETKLALTRAVNTESGDVIRNSYS
jgi:hypothetical protein